MKMWKENGNKDQCYQTWNDKKKLSMSEDHSFNLLINSCFKNKYSTFSKQQVVFPPIPCPFEVYLSNVSIGQTKKEGQTAT